jgi:hypothetical protein
MDGILIPIVGVLVSVLLGLVCLVVPRLRCFLLAALASPFLTSIAFLLGAFTLADMNPAREYGAAYIPTGQEHDPTKLDYGLWLLAVLATFALSSALAYGAQRLSVTMLQNALAGRQLGDWLSKRRWFGLAK